MILFALLSLLTLGTNSLPLGEDDGSHQKELGMVTVNRLPGSFRLKPEPWNIMKLTQSWPPAVCIFLENDDRKCEISSNITSWVIHGLWPTESGSEGPNFCNNTWKFNLDEVKSLRPRLDINWPSITFNEPPQDTWKHEWEKHGTCGASLPAISSELKYFNVTLGLHSRYNLSKILSQGGVFPSDSKHFKVDDILEILRKGLGVTPSITCVKDNHEKTPKFYLEQVELCLSKDFKPVDCESSDSQSRPRHVLHDLFFKSETSFRAGVWKDDVLQSTVHGCDASGDVYYKPMPPRSE